MRTRYKNPVQLPKSVGDRILLCILLPFVSLVVSVLVVPVFAWKPETPLEVIAKAVAGEAAFMVVCFLLLGFVWGLFAPSWLERVLQKHALNAVLVCFVLLIGTALGLLLFVVPSEG